MKSIVWRLFLVQAIALAWWGGGESVSAAEAGSNPPELRLSLHDAIQAAIDNNVNVRLLRERIAAAQSVEKTSLGDLLPNLSGYATGRNQTVNLAAFGYGWIGLKPDEGLPTRSVGLMLSVPIFDGGQREGRISESRSRLRQESLRMKDVSDQVTLEVRNALLTLDSSTQQVQVAGKGIDLAMKELTFARDRYEAGLATNIEVTNAQTSVARARDNVIEALFRFNASRINLARAKGELEQIF